MTTKTSLSIRTILISGFGGLLLIGITSALYFGLSAAFQNTRDLLTEQAEGFVTRMVEEVDSRLAPVETQALWISKRVLDGRLNLRTLQDTQSLGVFDAIMAATPQVGAVAVISAEGVLHQWDRDGDSVLVEDRSHDEYFMQWVRSGAQGMKQEWGPPFWLDSLDTTVVIYQTALFDSEGYFGVLAFAVTVTDLSAHLARISDRAFILVGRDDVLAHPLMIDWRPLDESSLPTANAIYEGRSALVSLTDLGYPILEHIWIAEYQYLVIIRDMGDTRAVAADVGDRQFVYLYRTVDGYGPQPWTIGTYLESTTGDDVIKRLDWALVAGLIVILVSVVFSYFLSRAIVRPVQALSRASESVQQGNLHVPHSMPVSRITELNRAMLSFQEMITGLAERDVIRRTLGRYVPQAVAQKLLEDDGSLQPYEGEATILFADIAGFTALTEKLGPSRIVEVLNAYFSRMTEIIERNGGVITQFQGDAILAIFNIPVESVDHADRACQAASDMQKEVAHVNFAGERLSIRIEINSGNVVAGAVGAEGRLTYTVHGDAVNLAARVEAMNKETGTGILISEATARLLDHSSVREVGTLEVRGQAHRVTVYGLE